jgi:UDP-N-acetylglucosamine 4-epimerase
LNELFETIRSLVEKGSGQKVPDVIHRDFRAGDIRHSCADTTRVTRALGFAPEYSVMQGLSETVG